MTERLSDKNPCDSCKVDRQIGNPNRWQRECDRCDKPNDWKNDCIKKLAEYETAEEEGRLVVLPCKVGDYIWDIDVGRPCAYEVTGCSIGNLNDDYCDDVVMIFDEVITYYSNYNVSVTGNFAASEIGKSIFLTREEAEKELKEMEGK